MKSASSVRLTGEQQVAKRWVEENYPNVTGSLKAALIIAYGAGVERGFAESEEMLGDVLDKVRTEVSADNDYSVK